MDNKRCTLFRTGHILGGYIFSLFTASYCSFIMAELIATFCHSFHYLLWPFVCFSLLLYFFLSHCRLDQWRSHSDTWNHLLVVTAHPDDECMFFAPMLLHFRRRKKNISVLCLSTGNYYHLGSKRRLELVKSCNILGIPEKNVTVIDESCFPDDPTRIWNEELVARTILQHIEDISPDVLLTFDRYGVTGHNNHISVYCGCRKILHDGRVPNGVAFLSLETTNPLRKYISFLDVPLSVLLASRIYISPLSDVICAQRAMFLHWTQLTWYRMLYIIFSRYMLLNTVNEFQQVENVPR
ncbi:PIGL [Acanthosepion pharaonis]|uniref:N-acetylglucosaminylphosphatidylinositol deacetylase n=1 Tax=Acanthosepion pharaonis TaxID=158019 RepID=A0A812BG36_ACAPH|nr:PIGL [Sepia pharaonis]